MAVSVVLGCVGMVEATTAALVSTAVPMLPQRAWLDALALVVPGATATRWLLLCDVVCLVGLALAWRRPWLAIPAALGIGFIVLNGLGLLLTDFFLGLAAFHLLVGVTTLAALRSARWLGGTALVFALALGMLT